MHVTERAPLPVSSLMNLKKKAASNVMVFTRKLQKRLNQKLVKKKIHITNTMEIYPALLVTKVIKKA